MATTFLEAAGPSRAPAVVIHPDDPLPRTWRVVSTWTYRGQRGAWLEYVRQAGSFRRESDAALAHVVYRQQAPRARNTSVLGSRLARWGSRPLVCTSIALRWWSGPGHPPNSTEAQEEADYRARSEYLGRSVEDLCKLDTAAMEAASDEPAANPEVPSAPREPLGVAIGAAIESGIMRSALAMFVAKTAPSLLSHGREHGAQAARDGNDRWRKLVASSQGEAFAAEAHKEMGAILDAAFGPAEPEWPDIPDVFRRAFEGEDR